MNCTRALLAVSAALLLGACGGGVTGGADAATDSDSGATTDATMSGDVASLDADVVIPNDTAAAETSADATDATLPADVTDAPLPPDGTAACAGMECSGWSSALSDAASLRGASGATATDAVANCVIQMHQSDCCGARIAYGFNHAARTQLCNAESTCTMQYPTSPGCTSTLITTDTGDTTMDPNQVRLRAVNPMPCTFGTCYTCETFVCTDASCLSAPGIMPAQCG